MAATPLNSNRCYSKTVTWTLSFCYSKTNTVSLSFWGVLKKKAGGPRALEDRKLFEPSPALAITEDNGQRESPVVACGARDVSLAKGRHAELAPPSKPPSRDRIARGFHQISTDTPLGQVPPQVTGLPEAADGRTFDSQNLATFHRPSLSNICLTRRIFSHERFSPVFFAISFRNR